MPFGTWDLSLRHVTVVGLNIWNSPEACSSLYVMGTLTTPDSNVLVLSLRNSGPATIHGKQDLLVGLV